MIRLIFLIMFSLVIIVCAGYAQPKTLRESIPSDISKEVRENIDRLYSANAVERAKAARALGYMGIKAMSAHTYLKEMLNDNTKVEWEEFGFMDVGRVGWYSVSTTVAEQVEEALKNIGEIDVERLIEMLKDTDFYTGRASTAASRLGYIKDTRAVFPLINALKDENKYLRGNAAEALGNIGDERAVEPLINILGDKDIAVAMAVTKALEKIGKPAVDFLIYVALNNKEEDVRRDAIEILGKIRDPRALEPLMAILKDKDSYVSFKATEALGNIGDRRAVSALIEMLRDVTLKDRSGAASALGEIKDVQAIPALINALNDKDEVVQNTSAMALKEMTGQDFGKGQLKWQEWWEKNKGSFEIR